MRMRSTPSRKPKGFTLGELMITLALAAVMAAIAVPNMRDFIRNNRLTGAANDLLRSVQLARSEAIKRHNVVAVCASANPLATEPTCSGGAFTGWIVFEDTNNSWTRDTGETILERKSATGVDVVNNNDGVVSYAPSGFANSTPGKTPTNRVVICDDRGNQALGSTSTARALIIEQTGRAHATRDYTDVSAALGTIGGDSCS